MPDICLVRPTEKWPNKQKPKQQTLLNNKCLPPQRVNVCARNPKWRRFKEKS